MNKPEYIVIHHSLTKDSETVSWDAIRRYHIAQGWSDIGYNYGIEMVGGNLAVMVGRSESQVGAHTKELNMNGRSIGICVVGNYDLGPPPIAYLEVLSNLCRRIMRDYELPSAMVVGHREVGELAGFDWKKGQYKTCPGTQFDMDAFRWRLVNV